MKTHEEHRLDQQQNEYAPDRHDRDFLDRVVTSTIALEGDGRILEYAGGYSDYLSQRGEEETPNATTRTKPKPKRPRSNDSKKLSFKHEHRAKELSERLPQLEAEVADIEAKLSSPVLFENEPRTFEAFAGELDTKRRELGALEEEWLEIELMREKLKDKNET